jgi:hypothetical protein
MQTKICLLDFTRIRPTLHANVTAGGKHGLTHFFPFLDANLVFPDPHNTVIVHLRLASLGSFPTQSNFCLSYRLHVTGSHARRLHLRYPKPNLYLSSSLSLSPTLLFVTHEVTKDALPPKTHFSFPAVASPWNGICLSICLISLTRRLSVRRRVQS